MLTEEKTISLHRKIKNSFPKITIGLCYLILNFDICYLLGELDEGSTKGLIKGLVMQAYHQEKELKKVKEELEYLKNKKSPKEEQENYKKELLKEIESKDEKIEFLTLRIQKMNLILKEVTLDNENLLKKINN